MYPEAIQYFTEAIELDSNNRVHFANRFTAYMAAGLYNKAADDAEMCIGIPLCTTLKPWCSLTLIFPPYRIGSKICEIL